MPYETFDSISLQKYYPEHYIRHIGDLLLISPSDKYQSDKILAIPSKIPLTLTDDEWVPIDLTEPFGDDIVDELFRAFNITGYCKFVRAYCRFGIYRRDLANGQVIQITDPAKAKYIQLIGIRDDSNHLGWMKKRSHPVEQQLDAVAAHPGKLYPNPATKETTCEWILRTDDRTKFVQEKASIQYHRHQAVQLHEENDSIVPFPTT